MNIILAYLWRRRTTAWGYIGATLGVLAVADGVLSPGALKWIVLANGIVTACIGHHNNQRMRRDGTVD